VAGVFAEKEKGQGKDVAGIQGVKVGDFRRADRQGLINARYRNDFASCRLLEFSRERNDRSLVDRSSVPNARG